MTTDTGTNIRILVATGLYPPEIGGPATYVRMLEEYIGIHGIALTVVPFTRVRHLPKFVRHVAYAWKLWRVGGDCDLVFALDSISVGVPALCASFFLRKPFWVRLGGDYAWEQGQQRFGLSANLDEYTQDPLGAPWQVRMLAGLQSFVVSRAAQVIAPSEYLKGIIASWGIDPARIKVIYSALFPIRVEKSKEQLREAWGLHGTMIASVGRLVPWKGFSGLIDAIAALRSEIPDLQLMIAGDGPEQQELEAKIRELHLEDAVRLQGRLDKERLGELIKASDIFVLNTAYEGLSHQLLEVMALRVPIVTTNVGGNPELVVDGVSGLLVPLGDRAELQKAIRRLISDADLRQRLTQHASVRVLDFSPEKVVAQFAERVQAAFSNT